MIILVATTTNESTVPMAPIRLEPVHFVEGHRGIYICYLRPSLYRKLLPTNFADTAQNNLTQHLNG